MALLRIPEGLMLCYHVHNDQPLLLLLLGP